MEDFTLIQCRSAEDFRQKLAKQPHTEFLALTRDPALQTQELNQSREQFHTQPDLSMLSSFSPSQAEALTAWKIFPIRVAALRQNWTKDIHAVILRTALLTEGVPEVSEPLWDLMIRISKSPDSIQARQAAADLGKDSPPQTLELPGLAPEVPGSAKSWLKSHLQSAAPEDLVPKVTSRPDAIALQAGLFQMHDFFQESHELSQSIEGEGRNRAGDYWHALMHRREPDYGNAKYWFRQVGTHPIFDPLRKSVEMIFQDSESSATQNARRKLLAKSQWDPFAFVDFCQECAQGDDPERTRIAEEIQWREMCLLLEQSYHDASS
jgi:hypothetical protein